MNTWGGAGRGQGRKKGKRLKKASERLSECISIHVSPDELTLMTEALEGLYVENRSRFFAKILLRWCKNILRG